MAIYDPDEDSYLLSETLKQFLKNKYKDKDKNKQIKILDIGSGSGIHAETCRALGFKDITTADINQESIKLLKNKGFKSIKSDLFDKINTDQKFDLIIFNPPYLPEDKDEPIDSRRETTAGKKGYELIIRFLKEANHHLTQDGSILLLISSLSKPKTILRYVKYLGFKRDLLASKKLFFEELFVYEFKI